MPSILTKKAWLRLNDCGGIRQLVNWLSDVEGCAGLERERVGLLLLRIPFERGLL